MLQWQVAGRSAQVRPEPKRSLAGLRRVSKLGLRVYAKSTNLPRVLGGLGRGDHFHVFGLLTDRQAARQGVAAKSRFRVVAGRGQAYVANW